MAFKIEQVSWEQTHDHLALVNQRCCLREPIDTRSNLHNRDKNTTRSYSVLDKNGQKVGGFTLRTNTWYLCEVKYIFADSPKILAFLLKYALALGKRPLYQVTVGASEHKLAGALALVGFTSQATFTYKNRKVEMWSKVADQRAEPIALLPEEEAALLLEKPGTKAFAAAKKLAAKKALPAPAPETSAPAVRASRYPDEQFRGTKMHRHGSYSWHSMKVKHKGE